MTCDICAATEISFEGEETPCENVVTKRVIMLLLLNGETLYSDPVGYCTVHAATLVRSGGARYAPRGEE